MASSSPSVLFIARAVTIRLGREKSHSYSKWTAAVNVIHVTAVWQSHICMQMSMYWAFLLRTAVPAMIQMSEPSSGSQISSPSKPPWKKKENMKDVLRRPWGNDLQCEGLAARTWHHSLRASSQRPLDVQHIVCCKKKTVQKKQRSKGYQAAVSNKRML